jgi:hypothetical protein
MKAWITVFRAFQGWEEMAQALMRVKPLIARALEPHRHRLCRPHRARRQMPYPRRWRASGPGARRGARQWRSRPCLFELDSLTRPGAGAHPGATVLPPALAIAQERGADGRALIAAFVAGNEVMIRIGRATGHTNEARGFHAPGTTGPFGAAVAAGHLLRLDTRAMTNALGIAGSLCGGLLEFARGDGGMVKRLHLGRASEAGVLAASLAADGFAGPRTVIEGEFGFLRVFCTNWDLGELTRGLGNEFVGSSTVLKLCGAGHAPADVRQANHHLVCRTVLETCRPTEGMPRRSLEPPPRHRYHRRAAG